MPGPSDHRSVGRVSVRRLTRGALSNAASLFVRIAVNFVLTPFLILYLGNGPYGVWMTLVTFTLSGSLSFFSFGFQGALIKYVAGYHAVNKLRELNEVFSATFLVYTGVAVACALAVAIFAQYFLTHVFNIPVSSVPAARAILFVFAVMIVVELPGLAIRAIIEGLQRYDLLALLDVGRLVVFAGGAWATLHAGRGLLALACVMFVSTAVYVVAMGTVARRLVPSVRIVLRGNRATLRELYRLTRDLFILRVNNLVYDNMDKMIIGAVLTTTLVTDYDIANRIHGLTLSVMGLAPSVVLPAASALDAANDSERQRQLLLKGSKYAIAMTLPLVVALYVLADGLIRYWISPQYAYVATYARVFLSYMFFWPVIQVGSNMLVGVNQVRSIVRLQTFSVIVNLVLSIILARYLGVVGPIVGTAVASLLIVAPYMRLILRTFRVSLADFIRTVAVPSYVIGLLQAAGLTVLVSVRPPGSLREVGIYLLGSVLTSYVALFLFFVDPHEKAQFMAVFRRASPTPS